KKYRLRRIGRLRYFLNHFKPQLDQFVAEFEYVKDQVGAIVMLEGRIVGIEIAPSHQYWQEIWMPLLRECYGSLVLEYRHYMGEVPSEAVMKLPFSSKMTTLADLRAELTLLRQLEEYAREDVFKDALSDVALRLAGGPHPLVPSGDSENDLHARTNHLPRVRLRQACAAALCGRKSVLRTVSVLPNALRLRRLCLLHRLHRFQ
ncbi:MAG: hypothetical protein MUD08_19075, partial [Cytophagales bacterium]|nr:hypothetical protein [Cytophagales bacterium]